MSDAEDAYRKAIDSDPRYARAYIQLANCLTDQGRLPDAEKVIQAAEDRLQSKTASDWYDDLGNRYREHLQFSAALASYRKSVERDVTRRSSVGLMLYIQQKWSEAEVAYRDDIARDPNDAAAHHQLGNILLLQGRLLESVEASKTAIKLRPRFANAYNTLANNLVRQGRSSDADAAQKKAVEFNAGVAEANAGYLRMEQGQFAEALACFQRAEKHGANYGPGTSQHRWAEKHIKLDARLPGILKGDCRPADAQDALALADHCRLPSRSYFAAAVRFYNEAFTANPALMGELRAGVRYDAACAAAQAGCGQGNDAARLDSNERACLREQAHVWLRGDLAAWRAELATNSEPGRIGTLYETKKWLRESALVCVRGEQALARLPEAERQEWRKLWEDVEELKQRAAKAK